MIFIGVAINKKVTLDNHIDIFLEKSVKISLRFQDIFFGSRQNNLVFKRMVNLTVTAL